MHLVHCNGNRHKTAVSRAHHYSENNYRVILKLSKQFKLLKDSRLMPR